MSETAEVPAPRKNRRTRTAVIGGVGALAVAAGAVLGVQAAQGGTMTAATAIAEPSTSTDPMTAFGGRGGFGAFTPGTSTPGTSSPSSQGGFGFGSGGTTSGGTGSSSVAAATDATADQLVGIVDIDTVLSYQDAEAAGTGMVLTSDGEVLTNNHVVEGATSITVTVLSTGATYTATVVGTDPTDDVAVLQLADASGLDTVQTADGTVAVGDAVTGVGNAGGAPGTSAAAGSVTAVDQSITATDESGSDAEQLTGLIEIAADIEAGDSGGPLYDATGQVVGMDTAASSTGGQAYAIPISTALSIAGQIVDGVDDATVHQGYPAFLGISVSGTATTGGAAIADVVSGGPAEQAGLAAGDVITAIGGTAITSADDVSAALADRSPGDRVSVTWTDSTGQSQSATVVLATGPAD